MRIAVTCRSELDRQGALKAYAKEKVQKLEHLYPKTMSAHVILDKQRFTHVAEVTLTVDGEPIVCVAKHEHADSAIEGAINKAAGRLRKLKDRRTEHRPPEVRRGEKVRRAKTAPKDALVVTPPTPLFVPIEATAAAALTPEAAVVEMEARGLEVILFKNVRTKRANVLYRMGDGRLGLVEASTRTK